jgi:hypothetical protein
MENVVRPDTAGKVEEIDAKYELLQRGQYQRLSNPLALKLDRRSPSRTTRNGPQANWNSIARPNKFNAILQTRDTDRAVR